MGLLSIHPRCMELVPTPMAAFIGQTCITTKELLPLVLAAALWGRSWRGHLVQFWSDNMAVVEVLSSRTSSDPQLIQLLRCLLFFQVHFGFELRA